MKKKISPNQLQLMPVGQGENARQSFTSWRTDRLVAEVTSLMSIAKVARLDYDRNILNLAQITEVAKTKYTKFVKIDGYIYPVTVAKAMLKFLSNFPSDQRERLRLLQQYCAELNERGRDTSTVDAFVAAEKSL